MTLCFQLAVAEFARIGLEALENPVQGKADLGNFVLEYFGLERSVREYFVPEPLGLEIAEPQNLAPAHRPDDVVQSHGAASVFEPAVVVAGEFEAG